QRGAPGRAPRRGAGKPPRPRRAGVLRTGPAALSRPRPARVGALRGLGLIGADRPNMGVRALALSGGEPSARRAASESLSIMISIEAILQRFRPVPSPERLAAYLLLERQTVCGASRLSRNETI